MLCFKNVGGRIFNPSKCPNSRWHLDFVSRLTTHARMRAVSAGTCCMLLVVMSGRSRQQMLHKRQKVLLLHRRLAASVYRIQHLAQQTEAHLEFRHDGQKLPPLGLTTDRGSVYGGKAGDRYPICESISHSKKVVAAEKGRRTNPQGSAMRPATIHSYTRMDGTEAE